MTTGSLAAGPAVIELKEVTFRFDTRLILDRVSMKVEAGTTKCVLGASGAGKSTILKLLLGLLEPESGEVWVLGKEVTSLKGRELQELRHSMGMVFQGGALFDSLSVWENIGYCPLETHHEKPEAVRTRVREILAMVGLGEVLDMMPSELSGGMKKRVAIARSFICGPRVMLYDEPTTGLDPIVSDTINELINRLRKENAVTGIVVTHIMRDAYSVADTMTLLREGQIIFDGTPEEIRASKDPYIQEFIA
ncbi:MAG: ABC-type transport system involved in resistance to organic solvent ATPase component [bacterium]|nr:MAG: ABC-type transport system involved in resistance to organic solvent ATPase component [bacterium]